MSNPPEIPPPSTEPPPPPAKLPTPLRRNAPTALMIATVVILVLVLYNLQNGERSSEISYGFFHAAS